MKLFFLGLSNELIQICKKNFTTIWKCLGKNQTTKTKTDDWRNVWIIIETPNVFWMSKE